MNDNLNNNQNEENLEDSAENTNMDENSVSTPEQSEENNNTGNIGDNQRYASPHIQYGGAYNNGQYSAYTPNGFKPEAPKTPSRNKKKGMLIAGITVIVVLVIALIAVIGVAVSKSIQLNDRKDNTKLELNESTDNTPSANVNSGDALTAKEVHDKVYKSSVGLLVYSGTHQRAAGEGSGIVMGKSGDGKGSYIITCAHVIDTPNARVVVQTHDGTQYEAKIIGADKKTDVGLVYVNTTDLVPAEFASVESLSVGDYVYAIGNPGGMQFFGSFTNGMISAIGRPVNSPVGYEVQCIQHTAAINPGNSGGALVNAKGQVIGINSSKIASAEYEGMGFAVPSSTVKEIVDQLIENGKVINRPVLGIKFAPVMANQTYSIIAQSNDLPAGSIIVSSVMNGSDMQKKGIKSGDIIIAANGKDLDTYDDLLKLVENGKVGDSIKLTICKVDASYKITKTDVDVLLVSDSAVSEPREESTSKIPFPFGN